MTKNLVLGAGKTGKSAYNFLKSLNQEVCVWDDHPETMASFGKDVFTSFDGVTRVILSPGLPILWPYVHPMYKAARLLEVPIISDIDLLNLYARSAKYIGVTGTNGKSTTTALLGFCLEVLRKNVFIGGNLGMPALCLPLHDEGIYVLEMSSYQLEACSLIEFDVGILLNITPDHLDRHGGMPGYVHAKQLIFKGAHCGVIGLDDPQVIEIYEFLKPLMGNRLIPISIKNHLDFGYCLKGTSIYRNGEFLWDMQEHPTLKGEHNAQNIMAVWGALHILGFLDMDILHTFMQFKGLAHRQEYVLQTPNGITFINDSKATNADATIQALKAYDQVYLILGGKPKAGGIGDLIPYFHKIRHALLIGEAANEFSGVLERYGVEFTITNTLEETLKFDFESQSTVLLSPACASFDQFDNFEQRGDMFKSLVLSKFEMY